MIFVYIQNREFLTKVLQYLDASKVLYTTDDTDIYSSILVADMSRKTEQFIIEHPLKKVIFLTELEEYKMYKNITSKTKKSQGYQNRLYKFLGRCNQIITSSLYLQHEFLKKYKNVKYIPISLPTVTISKNSNEVYAKYNFPKHRKKIVIVDFMYRHIDTLFLLSEKYPKYHFIYIGYESAYNLSARQKNFLHMLGDNITYIKYIDINIFSDICRLSNIVIYFESFIQPRKYLYIPLLLRKVLLVEDIAWYQYFFINSKNAYLFQNNDTLALKLSKIMDKRVMNLTENGYALIQEYDEETIIKNIGVLFK